MTLLKRLASSLPERWQSEMRRVHYARQVVKGTFRTPEYEYDLLPQFVRSGDWVLDIGANVGHYTRRLSDLVGPSGRVVALEPVPSTFALLAANVQLFTYANVTLINAAASSRMGLSGMSVPRFSSGLANYYGAHVAVAGENPSLTVATLSIDSLDIDRPIALVKVDVEGHESLALQGMQVLLMRYHPVLIVETRSGDVIAALSGMGYDATRSDDSPNVVFTPQGLDARIGCQGAGENRLIV
jgi:FkbM family methyltransferase